MRANKSVTIIPERKPRIIDNETQQVQKRKVAGYARVSTELDEQKNSYQSQLNYYTTYINSRLDWEFVGMYSDEGITGTSTKKREGFNKMVEDALDGKIDLIITKSVSRFARNTVDSLSTVRKLKDAGVEIYFEKENIYTFDQKGELMITIMSSLAQEESRSISENTTWGQRKRMADGHGCLGFSRFLGYDRGPNGEFVINEEQAKIVRRIFNEYIDGKNATQIAKGLTQDGIKTVTGKDEWGRCTILSILRNEKYKGDCLMQKYYIDNFLNKKLIKNKGELQQYYAKDHHEPIVSREVFDAVQIKLDKRSKKKNQSSARDFSSMIVCGECGAYYGSKVWHSNDKYKKFVYRCNEKYVGEKCDSPTVDESRLKDLFVEAINILIKDKNEILENLEILLQMKKNEEDYEKRLKEAAVNLDRAENNYREFLDQQKGASVDIKQYEEIMKIVSNEYEEAREVYDTLVDEERNRLRDVFDLENFIDKFKSLDGCVFDYNTDLMKKTVDMITVFKDKRVVFKFMGDREVEVKL